MVRRVLTVLLFAGVLAGASLSTAALPTAAAGAKGARAMAVLDPSFGTHGLTKFRSGSESAALGAATQDGGLVVSSGASVRLLSKRGGSGHLFGRSGSLTVPAAAGRGFQLGDFTVDPRGRLVIVGSSVYPASENPTAKKGAPVAFEPAALRILRLLPDGSLDPSFGQGGVVETDLGLPAPLDTDGSVLGTHPALQATGIAIDPSGRIVITGDSVVGLGPVCGRGQVPPVVVSAGFVLRLGENGAADPTFGQGGLVGGRSLEELPLGAERIEEPVVGPAGTVAYRSSAADPCSRASEIGIAQLTATGTPNVTFGKAGALAGRYRALAGAPDGSVVAVEEIPAPEGGAFKARISRYAPGGEPSASFGKGGRTTVTLAAGKGAAIQAAAVDAKGRVLLGGTLGAGKGRSLVLLRLSAAGGREKSFGPHGRVGTKVSGLIGPGSMFFDPQGRLLMVHAWSNVFKHHVGLVVARYLLRG